MSDFDGTAVEIVPKWNPRNWTKYPLKMVPGYADFIRGAIDGGLENGGIVSRRAEWARKGVTDRTIRQLGLTSFFGDSKMVYLAGSETTKAKAVVYRASKVAVGVIDDKPHKIGVELVRELTERTVYNRRRYNPIVLGVVNHTSSEEYTDRLQVALGEVDGVCIDTDVAGDTFTVYGPRLEAAQFMLRVVQLGPYTLEAGQRFAQCVQQTA